MSLINKPPKSLPPLDGVEWINGKPETEGNVTVIDFWTYTCINCLRVLPKIKELYEKYKDEDFVLIGIHSPEFDFEKDLGNVKTAVKEKGLNYPIAVDSNRELWSRFNNSYWPRQYVYDKNGNYIYDNIGEGNHLELENKIRVALGLDKTERKEDTKPRGKITPETYCGKLRGPAIPGRHCKEGECDNYKDPEDYEEGQIYLEGRWSRENEYLEHEGDEGRLVIGYNASEVNVVLTSNNYMEIDVLMDDNYLDEDIAGGSVHFDGNRSYMVIEKDDMYRIIDSDKKHNGNLKFEVKNKGIRFYAFTFG